MDSLKGAKEPWVSVLFFFASSILQFSASLYIQNEISWFHKRKYNTRENFYAIWLYFLCFWLSLTSAQHFQHETEKWAQTHSIASNRHGTWLFTKANGCWKQPNSLIYIVNLVQWMILFHLRIINVMHINNLHTGL